MNLLNQHPPQRKGKRINFTITAWEEERTWVGQSVPVLCNSGGFMPTNPKHMHSWKYLGLLSTHFAQAAQSSAGYTQAAPCSIFCNVTAALGQRFKPPPSLLSHPFSHCAQEGQAYQWLLATTAKQNLQNQRHYTGKDYTCGGVGGEREEGQQEKLIAFTHTVGKIMLIQMYCQADATGLFLCLKLIRNVDQSFST